MQPEATVVQPEATSVWSGATSVQPPAQPHQLSQPAAQLEGSTVRRDSRGQLMSAEHETIDQPIPIASTAEDGRVRLKLNLTLTQHQVPSSSSQELPCTLISSPAELPEQQHPQHTEASVKFVVHHMPL